MSVNQAVNLNLSTDIVPPVLKMVQNDSNSRYIVASLWDGASAYDVGSASVMLRFTKPDGTGGMYDADEQFPLPRKSLPLQVMCLHRSIFTDRATANLLLSHSKLMLPHLYILMRKSFQAITTMF